MEQPGSSNAPTPTNYANATKSTPTKNHILILKKDENLKLIDYINQVGTIIGLENITEAYNMSHNRVAIILKKPELIDCIITKYTNITINNIDIPIRRFITPEKKLIFTVPAYIPDTPLNQFLEKYNLKIVSPITHIPINNDPKYKHISSGKRQVIVLPDNSTYAVPDSFVVSHEYEDNIRIYVHADIIKCSSCSHYGHHFDQCRKNPPTQPITSIEIHTQEPTSPEQQ